ncbi:type IX secretion system sortase PorU [candidate division KSB1 bacterium]|nr:type IX secretion system sortase PorU [candidate division KSB1 bacterium]
MRLYSSFSKCSPIYALAAGFLCAISLSAAAQDAQVLQTGERQVTISYRLADLKFQQLTINGESAERPDFKNAIPINVAGAPELPTRVFVVGVPPGARAEVSIVPGTVEERSEIYVPPVPVKERADDLTRLRYSPDAQIYGRDAFYPADFVRVDPPAQFRQQTIVRVQVMPVQYNPVRKQLRIYRDLQIVVRFAGGAPPALSRPSVVPSSKIEEELYRDILLNYEQAKAFRSSRSSAKNSAGRSSLFRSASPQIDGPLYKFAIRQEGIYKIDGQTLRRAGITDINPSTIHLYNNGGRELPRDISLPRPEGLVENAIYVSDGGDGRFDDNDFILFYGRDVQGFTYDSTSGQASHYINHFGFDNYYWLSFGGDTGIRMAERTPQPIAGLIPLTSFKDRLFREEDLHPLYESDQTWYGFLFTNDDVSRSRRYPVKLTDPVSEGTADLRFAFYAPHTSSFGIDSLYVRYGSQELVGWTLFGSSRNQIFNVPKRGGLANGDNDITLTYRGSGDASQMYIDYFELVYDRQLRLSDGMLIFDGRVAAGNTAYTLSNADASALWLFDVSDFSRVTRLPAQNWQVNGTQVTFADAGVAGNVPRRYLAATPAGFKSIGTITRDEVSSWRTPNHAADMIIITHEDFLSINPTTGRDQGPLAKFVSLRENYNPSDTLKTVVVKIQDVFDEFSCGMYDPVAIRDFLKYAFENWQRPPSFVMLVGDGDYDPKNIINKTDKNWIPTFHTAELDDIDSRVTDSWFTYLAGNDAVMDMGIGRIPARSLAEVEAYVNKVFKYETSPTFGAWRNTAVMVADDEYGQGVVPSGIEKVHIDDTEKLINEYTPKYFDLKKIYLTEYAAVQSASISGVRKPTATEAFLRLVNNGVLLINYAGHGNSEVWAHERVLNLPTDFNRIQNGDRQALWIAATCTFGKYDIPERQSFSEDLVLASGRGAIAVLATSRDVYASSNAALNQQYYSHFFGNNQQISARLGTAMMKARTVTGFTINDEKFHVLGDPSLRLAIPRYNANITSVTPDTIKALAVMTVKGKVQRDGADWPDFNGTVRLEALDSRREVAYRSPAGFNIFYDLPGNSLFRGEAPVKNGAFTVQFFVPKDITYGGTTGRISLYFTDTTKFDGNGFRDNLPVGGTAGSIVDRVGPNINLGFTGVDNFQPGGVVGANPTLRVVLSDSLSGINITGEIGHKITLALDGQTDNKTDITDLFNYDSGSFTRGSVVYPLGDLAEGRHTVEIKAWDNLNNSNTAAVEFVVRAESRFSIDKETVMNYPNPFRNRTTFTFVMGPGDAEVRIKIFTLSGRLIRTLEDVGRSGFNQIEWDGRDEDGDELANGVYLYKIIAIQRQTGEALRAEEIGKLVVAR